MAIRVSEYLCFFSKRFSVKFPFLVCFLASTCVLLDVSWSMRGLGDVLLCQLITWYSNLRATLSIAFYPMILSRGGRRVKEKSRGSIDVSVKVNNGVDEGTTTSSNVATNTHVASESDGTLNEVTPVSDVMEGVTLSVVDMDVEKENLNSLEDTVIPGSLSLPTQVTTSAGNVTRKPSGKKLNIRTLFTPGGNGIYVVIPVESIRGKYGLVRSMFSSSTGLFSFQFSSMDGLDPILENGPWFIWNNLLILKKWHPDENLLKEDVSTVPVWVKLHGVPVTAFSEDGLSAIATKLGTPLLVESYTSDICMQSWGRSSYARVMIELRADVELKDNIVVAMPKIIGEGFYICNVRVECVGEKNTAKKPSQTSRAIPIGPKMGFKPQKEYIPISKKPTASSSGNKKKGMASTIELGTNGGTTNLVNNEATSSGSSFTNIDNSSTRTTPTIEKIGKFEELFSRWKATIVDEAGNPLKKVEYLDDYDSEDEVASVDNDMARSMTSERVLSQELQAICDNLDIRVRGRKKK
ncbi:zinc finger, CCHC-type containing protein [Tanacetum coccineum]